MALYNLFQVAAGPKEIRRRAEAGEEAGLLESPLLRALTKVFLLISFLVCLSSALLFSMNVRAIGATTQVENINYDLLGINLQLKSERRKLMSSVVLQKRAEEYGLYLPQKGQRRVYNSAKNYFSYR
ncbi:hypothetical protein [Desulfotalea psychrophila]|uniref:Cell division protein FtsL n=1 Tax=Desulfotalea psychrophila (strain LSv54 / DSM 12343) TaxID=177439 RepID=Q6AJ48_DESPS|nr:hypothetical protein [Desulfotalea psychrophila]CAG37632.1 unknown protein [Desulfotalea psychrophila LSv54]